MSVPTSDIARMVAGRARLGELAALFAPDEEEAPPLSPRSRRDLRQAMFAERATDTALRVFKAARAGLKRDGLSGCFRAAELMVREKTIGALGLPDPARALASPDGLCGVADDLSVATVMEAYERGLYPSGHLGPMKWWSPAIRAMVAPPALARRSDAGAIADFDRDFEAAVCDADSETPTPPRLKWAFASLFDAGFAHSFDISLTTGQRIGGGFGVAVGRVFVIESLRFDDAADRAAGLAALGRGLGERGFVWIDAKRLTPELAGDGFDGAPRVGYAAKLKSALSAEHIGRWTAAPAKKAA